MQWLKEEFSKSNIISGCLAIAIWGAVIYLSVIQAPIPDLLYAGGMSIIAFFFGSKVGQREGMDRAADLIARTIGGDQRGKL